MGAQLYETKSQNQNVRLNKSQRSTHAELSSSKSHRNPFTTIILQCDTLKKRYPHILKIQRFVAENLNANQPLANHLLYYSPYKEI